MSRPKRILIGIFSFVPILWIAGFFVIGYGLPKPWTAIEGTTYLILFAVITLTVVISLLFTLYEPDRVPVEKRGEWLYFLLSFNVVAAPIYWYFYIWKHNDNKNTL